MPPFAPIKRQDLIRALRAAGFAGPFSGGKHAVMVREGRRVTIPNPHTGSEIGPQLLGEILRQAGISREEWLRL